MTIEERLLELESTVALLQIEIANIAVKQGLEPHVIYCQVLKRIRVVYE